MATTSLDEETSKKVIRQIEFYFSDSNLPRDNFLRKTISESEDGIWILLILTKNCTNLVVSLALICSFSRMRSHLGLGDLKADGIPEDTVNAVADTLRSSDFLKISEDGKKVGRKTELPKPEEVIEQLDSRTIAASPLPYDVKLEDVESLFAQYAKVNSVRLPRHVANKNLFCGTALVEFSSEEDVEKVLQTVLEFAGANLELKPKKDFDAEREKQEQKHENSHGRTNCKGSEESNYPKGLLVAFTLKSKSSGGDKQNGADKPVSEVEGETAANTSEDANKLSGNGTDADVEGSEEKDAQETTGSEGNEVKDGEELSEGTNKKGPEEPVSEEKTAIDISREDLKPIFEKFGTVKYIDFRIGAESGYIRFEEPEAAQKARAAAVLSDEGGLIVKNYIAILEPVTAKRCGASAISLVAKLKMVRRRRNIGAKSKVVKTGFVGGDTTREGVANTTEVEGLEGLERIIHPLVAQTKFRKWRLEILRYVADFAWS
ncbi:hypothetical protein Cgig2_028454 [Carnegiea gigantea]|uniref:La protein 1 n=1 Tax=Carnegiea gigantea TaxID=171969 RepID=A0A9Q1QL97_9CARY|nr:hypothetical protein Cgig2_028454 [Carnegiea gigantea]